MLPTVAMNSGGFADPESGQKKAEWNIMRKHAGWYTQPLMKFVGWKAFKYEIQSKFKIRSDLLYPLDGALYLAYCKCKNAQKIHTEFRNKFLCTYSQNCFVKTSLYSSK